LGCDEYFGGYPLLDAVCHYFKKGRLRMNSETVKELVERLTRIESEQKLLTEDKKCVIAEYKDKLDVKAVQAAIRVAKIMAKLDTSDQEFDNIMSTVSGSLCLSDVS
jgi:uncharacterized protein (UPF0335 family)